jgi:putative endonuclease
MAEHNKLGEEGEKIAVNYLKNKGYLVYHTNWRLGHLEIDIIAEDKNELVFIEVKTRSSVEYGMPEEAVDEEKENALITAAHYYLQTLSLEIEARFDVISVILNKDRSQLNHFVDAFSSTAY